MRIRFWRRKPTQRLPRQVPPNERPTWATQPTQVFPTTDPGRAGNLTRGQRWRANGGRW
ncbi:hypothetical protein Q3W71_19275 [Micromonospora sp. C28SCA-DRY-2]|uniref:hypothetical protein n=1 Tax=Micromonospora sp. C28SCA-DRY-2 TaxID=3059522 RepID=UPI00267709C2|nr:hypothetical protein [Micromonospora sp. C28SCA-DRY-2]MDO3703812.1 hypothetical protein [Micromonospora sp. C28SCA-DRY-2]